MKQNDLVVGLAWGLAVGVVAGTLAGLLLAPRSGIEIRRKLGYERDHAVDVARRNARRAMARLRRDLPGAEEGEEEDDVAFSGA
jgi:gas vesicle protein